MRAQAILETAIYATDLAAAERFYAAVFGLPVIGRQPDRHVFFRCGDGVLLVFDPRATASQTVEVGAATIPRHGRRGPGHFAFRTTVEEIPRWRDHLAAHGVEIEAEIAWPAGGRSLYVRDPAGNSVEIASPELWDPAPAAGGET